MKVTVTFGDTAVVVPCKAEWTVRNLTEQANRRYRRFLEQQHGDSAVKTKHLEYIEGGILDMDDVLSDLVEDRDKLVAVFEVQAERTDSPRETMSNGYYSPAPSPEPPFYLPHLQYNEPIGGEIEVNEAVLKANTPLLVRSSSDSALAPPTQMMATPSPTDNFGLSPETEIDHELSRISERVRTESPTARMSHVNFSTLTRTVEFPGDWGPLGIHVIPYYSSLSGRTLGLHIKGIEESSRAKKENLFREDECIVQINDTLLQDKTFNMSQDVFRQAMTSSSIRLEVVPMANKPRYEKSLIGQIFTGEFKDTAVKAKSPMVLRANINSQTEPKLDTKPKTKPEVNQPVARVKTPEPDDVNKPPVELHSVPGSLEGVSPVPPTRTTSASTTPRTGSPLATKSPGIPGLAGLTSKKGGKRLKIDLKKGTEGLGFTVVTRDSSIHGPGPILVKNILPRGAAIKDGRLQPGDRILEVNRVDMAGRSQEELVAMLRSTRQGESVSVVVARQEDIFLPRELKDEDEGSPVSEDGREQLMYEIPLNETGSAGLGVSLKGNKSRETGEDLGIFIKSIIHGGAAYKDGRLSVNDQLIAVNGESLLGRANHASMETLRRSMSAEGTSRGTIQLVVFRATRPVQQIGYAHPPLNAAANESYAYQHNTQSGSNKQVQEPLGHNMYQSTSGPAKFPNTEPPLNGISHNQMTANNHAYESSGSAPVAGFISNGSYRHHGNSNELEQDFPPPPSHGTVEEINKDLPQTYPPHSVYQRLPHMMAEDIPQIRASKSMDLVADESNMGSMDRQGNESSATGLLGPTLGLWKSSSLESLQSALSEVKQSRIQEQVPFHRPRPHMVRGRGSNQSFRIAIDKSYDGPSEDDDGLSEQSSGHETAASSSSRHGLDAEDGKKKKKTKGKKKEKKIKGKKKADDSVEDLDKKTKKKGFALLRFGKKKDDKSKDAAKASKNKLAALSEEELDPIPDKRDSYDLHYVDIRSAHVTPDLASIPDVQDDDSDPNYASIDNFRRLPSPHTSINRSPSPAALTEGLKLPQASTEELDGLYAKVNKSRLPLAQQNQHPPQAESDQPLKGMRREYQQARAAPGYEELNAARQKVLDFDPQRMAPRDSRPAQRYEERGRQYPSQPRRDPYDYPTHSIPIAREPASTIYQDPPAYSRPSTVPIPQSGSQSHQELPYYPSSPRTGRQHHAPLRQDVPPSPTVGRGGQHYYEAAGGRVDAYRHASPGRYISPDRYPVTRERYTSPERYNYKDERQTDPRRKNPVIGAV